MMMYRFYFVFLFSFLFCMSCESEKRGGNKLQTVVTSFIENSNNIIGYGFVDLSEIVKKGELKGREVFDSFLSQQLTGLDESIFLSEKVLFAFENSENSSEMPHSTYFFMQIKNQEKLQLLLDEMGFNLEEKESMKWFYDESLALGHDDDFLIVVVSEEENNVEELLFKAFEDIYTEKKNTEIEKQFSQENDLFLVANLENIVPMADLYDFTLPSDQKKRIEELTKNGQVSFSITFKEGGIESEISFLNASDELNDALFLKEKTEDDILGQIGAVNSVVEMAASIDMNKLDDFVSLFYPESTRELFRSFGNYGMMFEGIAGEKMANVTNGNIGFIISEEENVFTTHTALGWGKEKQNMLDLANSLAEEGTLIDLGNGHYQYESSLIKTENNYLIYHQYNPVYVENRADSDKKRRKEYEKYPFYVFIDVKKAESIYMYFDDINKVAGEIDNILILANNKELNTKISLKGKEKNALAYLIDTLMDEVNP